MLVGEKARGFNVLLVVQDLVIQGGCSHGISVMEKNFYITWKL